MKFQIDDDATETTTLDELLAANEGDDYVALDLAPVLQTLAVGEVYFADQGAGGVMKFRRVE